MSLSSEIKRYAKEIGVDLIGFAKADFDEEGEERLKNFIARKRHGQMRYLENYQNRVRPQNLLRSAKTVIVIAINYYREAEPVPSGYGRIARYAYGRDYHKVIKKLLNNLVAFIKKQNPSADCRICVDSSPLLEKNYAVKAGLGFIGKNTTLITPQFGSFVLLGEIITNLELAYDSPATGTCGTCTRCIDACPTKAIVGERELDATRCISYLTIENRKQIPKQFHHAMSNWIFGCDICQEVCPYNKQNAKPLQLEELKKVKIAGGSIPLDEILNLKSDEDFLGRFAGSPLMRAKRKGIIRNAKIALKNA